MQKNRNKEDDSTSYSHNPVMYCKEIRKNWGINPEARVHVMRKNTMINVKCSLIGTPLTSDI